jgi:hypothetical protein
MLNSPSTQPPSFTAEQKRILGQVYSLILSWRPENTGSNVAGLSKAAGGTQDETALQVGESRKGCQP